MIKRKKSSIHHYGLYAKKDIPAGTAIIQYVGDKITHKQAELHAQNNRIYIFELNYRYVIDGNVKNNLAKYINHSCQPNCYSEITDGEIWIYALHDILKDEELTYDYGFQRMGWHERPCYCGTKNCFGFVVARNHWSGISKTKRYHKLLASIKNC